MIFSRSQEKFVKSYFKEYLLNGGKKPSYVDLPNHKCHWI